MWRSTSVNHTPNHEPSLPAEPDIVIKIRRDSPRPHLQAPTGPGPERERRLGQAPFRERACRGDRASATRQRLVLDAALVRAHPPPRTTAPARDAVAARARRPDGLVGTA